MRKWKFRLDLKERWIQLVKFQFLQEVLIIMEKVKADMQFKSMMNQGIMRMDEIALRKRKYI